MRTVRHYRTIEVRVGRRLHPAQPLRGSAGSPPQEIDGPYETVAWQAVPFVWAAHRMCLGPGVPPAPAPLMRCPVCPTAHVRRFRCPSPGKPMGFPPCLRSRPEEQHMARKNHSASGELFRMGIAAAVGAAAAYGGRALWKQFPAITAGSAIGQVGKVADKVKSSAAEGASRVAGGARSRVAGGARQSASKAAATSRGSAKRAPSDGASAARRTSGAAGRTASGAAGRTTSRAASRTTGGAASRSTSAARRPSSTSSAKSRAAKKTA